MNNGSPVPLRTLAWEFNRISISSFGGGLSAWSRKVIVEDRGWLNDEEFLSALTICRVMPGANQINLAIYVGAKLRGPWGAFIAVFGLCCIPVLITLGLAVVYFKYHHEPSLQRVLQGMAAAATGMSLSMGFKTGGRYLHQPIALTLALAAFLASGVFHLPLLLVLSILVPLGALWGLRETEKGKTS